MKTYQSTALVNAQQWDGTVKSQEEIRMVFNILHNAMEYNDDGAIKSWSVGKYSNKMQAVPVGSYFVKQDNGQLMAVDAKAFESQFEPVKAKK